MDIFEKDRLTGIQWRLKLGTETGEHAGLVGVREEKRGVLHCEEAMESDAEKP